MGSDREKAALVTGGNSGIGYETARLLKEHGYEVTIVGRSAERTREAAERLGVSCIVADLSDPDACVEVAGRYRGKPLDLLVNNAGLGTVVPLEGYNPELFDEHFHVNVRAPLLLTKELLTSLERCSGVVTMISSIITVHGAPAFALYAATKGALEAAVRSLAIELAPRGVRINAVAPGAVDTPIFSKIGIDEAQREAVLEHHRNTIPMGRLAKPEEIAQVVVSQSEASYVTGAVWTVDGGVDA